LDKLIKEDQGNQTILVVAHRLSTIKNADVIAVLARGGVVEAGNHSELISKRGAYHALVEAQKGKGTESRKSSKRKSGAGFEEISTALVPASTTNTDVSDDIISFQDVEFKYPSRPEQKIFEGLEMSVKKGETLAIVGPR
jgi:ABC-type multidrug transport system fused ATPase/permease subunit